MAELLRRAAGEVRETHPGPRLMVGALSLRRGGPLQPHRSHQNGRDADLALYLVDARGQPVEAPRFVAMGEDGCGDDRGTRYCLDGARTFALLAAMLEDSGARVQWFLIAEDLRERILAAGRDTATPERVDRVALATEPHAASEYHRDHVHVRIYCAPADRPGCVDTPPFHPWYEGEPPQPNARRGRRVRTRQRARRARRRARARRRRARARARRRRARRRPR